MKPRVSVIMPVYNAQDYLEESVLSILNQSFRDFEFIIVEDGSSDDSPRILERFARQDQRISLIRNERNKPSSAKSGGPTSNGMSPPPGRAAPRRS